MHLVWWHQDISYPSETKLYEQCINFKQSAINTLCILKFWASETFSRKSEVHGSQSKVCFIYLFEIFIILFNCAMMHGSTLALGPGSIKLCRHASKNFIKAQFVWNDQALGVQKILYEWKVWFNAPYTGWCPLERKTRVGRVAEANYVYFGHSFRVRRGTKFMRIIVPYGTITYVI